MISMWRAPVRLVLWASFAALAPVLLGTRLTGMPPLGTLLDPKDGLYRTARLADAKPPERFEISGLEEPVHIEWDDRGVPHVFARTDLDAMRAVGFVTARDRLFQLDFLPRAASGRLAAALGPAAIPADRFLRRTGMDWGARKNLRRIVEEDGPELATLEAYAEGVNAFISRLDERDLPFEFRLLGYRPDPWTPMQTLRLLQYMNYDLTYATDQPSYDWLQDQLSKEDFDLLYPRHATPYVPVIPEDGRVTTTPSVGRARDARLNERVTPVRPEERARDDVATVESHAVFRPPSLAGGLASSLLEGFMVGKGSNNWAVGSDRSSTGRPILAGDMHLAVTLPSIWYEVHVVTPTMNSYGVTIPGAPLPVEAFNDHLAWAYTNTGADQIDHYRIELDGSGTRFRFGEAWSDVELVTDTIFVRGDDRVLDTLRYAHWGPIMSHRDEHYVLRWTAHEPSRTLLALTAMNGAQNRDDFEHGLRHWDSPMQNILYADVDGTISIRSTGRLPVRRGGDGAGLLDGSTSDSEWIGRVPFDELPYALNPQQGFLTSTNQQPTDSSFAYYVGHDWGDQYRSIRIDTLLRSRSRHTSEHLAAYQSDVHAVQYDLFFPLLDTLSGVTGRADSLRRMLRSWDGTMTVDRLEPFVLDVLLQELERLTWDEPVFKSLPLEDGDRSGRPLIVPRPKQSRLYVLLRDHPEAKWLDVLDTDEREGAAGLLRAALDAAAERISHEFGWKSEDWRWGNHRKIQFNHLIDSPALRSLGRGPMEYPGYRETLSPAGGRITTHSASWRVVVDFADGRPRGRGVYPGGQSGNPFARRYDLHVPTYLAFEYYDLLKPDSAGDLEESRVVSRTLIRPGRDTK